MALASQGTNLICCPFEYFFLYPYIAISFLNLQLLLIVLIENKNIGR